MVVLKLGVGIDLSIKGHQLKNFIPNDSQLFKDLDVHNLLACILPLVLVLHECMCDFTENSFILVFTSIRQAIHTGMLKFRN